MFTRALAQELTNSGVIVNSLHPGMVDTDMQVDLRSVDTGDSPLDFTRFHEAHEQGRLRTPQDVALAVTWLAGPWSRDHNGQIFSIADEEWIRKVNADLGE
jgi:NAD(P)-dependent dehydrogenase (short-subunit alcohol dehydrogenase family)